jgi:integrase
MPRRKLDKPNYRLRDRGGVWYIDWTDESSGRSRSISTRQTECAKAEIWRDQWIAGRAQPLPPSQPTVAAILDAYVTARLPHVESKETLRLCAKTITRLIGNLEPRMLVRGTYLERRARIVGPLNGRSIPVSPGTLRREITVLRAALSWAFREKWIAEKPYVEMPPKPPPRERWLTRDEIDRLVSGGASYHIRLFVILAYHTAARSGAILDLTWDRVDFDRRIIVYDRPGRRKTNKRRATVPLNTPALAALQEAYIVRTTDYVIEYNGRKVASIKKAFGRACKRAGIVDCSPHVLRHSAASHMVMASVPLKEVADMLGDTMATVEKVYAKWSPDYLRRAADALAGNIKVRNAKTEAIES